MAKKSTPRSSGLKSSTFSAKKKSTPQTSSSARPAAFPMKKKRANPLLLAGSGAAVLLIILLAVVFRPKTGSLPAEISVAQGYEKYQQGAFVLDVREQVEWDEYHAPNTTLIPLGELSSRLSELPKDQEIVVVCRSGNRSQEGRDILKQAGFTNVTSMAGGLSAWRDAGYPIEP